MCVGGEGGGGGVLDIAGFGEYSSYMCVCFFRGGGGIYMYI